MSTEMKIRTTMLLDAGWSSGHRLPLATGPAVEAIQAPANGRHFKPEARDAASVARFDKADS